MKLGYILPVINFDNVDYHVPNLTHNLNNVFQVLHYEYTKDPNHILHVSHYGPLDITTPPPTLAG
jgi:hypothetical protein